MKTNYQAKSALAALTALAFITGNSAQATLLVYEGFDTATTTGVAAGPTSNGFRLQGKAGGMGFATGSTWNTYVNSNNPITVYAQGATPGTNFITSPVTPLTYNGTCAN
ncbi:MAG: hypothetical protein EB078_02800 [Proteobacteria bacterium]|nr:hypothetical protein [Pseudomonadota bacterium]